MSETETRGLSEPQQAAVRNELHRLLDSATFRSSKRCREFLQYIVEHTIAGASGSLKERSIGVELFQLPQDFDTGQRTIVRVTANEVRKKLAQHYLAENGASHPVRIDLPPGSYSAEFTWDTPPSAEPLPARPKWLTPAVIAAAALVLILAAAIPLWRERAGKSKSNEPRVVPVAAVAPAPGAIAGPLRIVAGATSTFMDRSGRPWGPDRFFSGGGVIARPSERIFRTLDPDIYRHARLGDFKYDIPIEPGSYEMHLHFAETGLADSISAESSGEGQRLFRVAINGKPLLPVFDVVADANGANTADERVFRDVSPGSDGYLHLAFAGLRGTAMLSGIELLPVSPGKVRPIRIRAGWTTSWQDSSGRQWQGDSYFLGGNALVRTTNPAEATNSIVPDKALYASERWGHFSYALPVADGRYRVTLKFCEGHYGPHNQGGGGLGNRVFDVYCNGVALLRNFDIFKEAGGEGRPLDREFSGVRPTAQGKIVLTFVPINGMACVNGIEVEED